MKCIAFGVVMSVAFFTSTVVQAQAPSWTVPPENTRCPSKWGATDERGSANHMKPQAVLNAAKLIKTGEVIEIGHVLNDKMPFFGTRRFDVHAKRTFMNQFSNMRGSNEETCGQRDRPGRNAVRCLRASDASRQLVQLLQGRRECGARRASASSACTMSGR